MGAEMKLLLVVLFLAGCASLLDIHNPTSVDYPCGTRGIVCSSDPLACCWRGETCGLQGTSCPAGMCCYRGDDGMTAGGEKISSQWRPE